MRVIRTILDEDVIAIKGATDACLRLGGGFRSFLTRVGVSTLVKYASRTRNGDNALEHEDYVIPVDVAIEADRRAQSPIIIGEAARQLGYQLSVLSDDLRPIAALSERDAHVILKEAMDVSSALMAAFEDGKVDALERKQLRKEIRELIRAAEQILEKLGED